MGIGVFVSIWIARYLGPEKFGLLSFANAYVGLFGSIAGLGLQGIVVRDVINRPESRAMTLGTAAVLHLAGGLIAYFLILIGIFWLRPDDTMAKLLVSILGSMVLLRSGDIASYWFESQVLSKYIVWVQSVAFLIFSAIKVILILEKASLIAFAVAALAEVIVASLFSVMVFNLYGLGLRTLRTSMARARSLISDSWPLFLSGISIMIYMKIDQVMLGQIKDDQAVAIYSVAVRISEIWYFIPMMIISSLFPTILKVKKNSEEDYHQKLQHLYDLMVVISLAVAIPMSFLSTNLVTLLFGEAYASAGPVLAIHIWTALFVFLGVASSQSFVIENRQLLSLQRTLFGAILNVALNLLFIPVYGAIGAAIATVIAQLSVGLLFDAFQSETRQMFQMKMRALDPIRAVHATAGLVKKVKSNRHNDA